MYIIIEIQKQNDGTAAILPALTYTDIDEAEAAYHTKLAFAAKSTVNVHTVTMISDEGDTIKKETYRH